MIRLNVCLRGAITVGGMHWNPQWSPSPGEGEVTNREGQTAELTPVAFGPGLVAAYELENGCAVYPRVLVANELYDRVEKFGGKAGQAFPLANAGKVIDFIRQDFDGLWHLDLLNKDINRRDVVRHVTEHDDQGRAVIRNDFDETTYEDRLKEFGRFVARNLDLGPKEAVLAKYQWCARYFNEKARAAGVNTIPIFKDEVPKGQIPFTIKTP
jgi:hypothetical protein